MSQQTPNITLHIEGMDCSNCALGITRSLEKKGLNNVNVSFATGEATFYLNDKSKLKSIIDNINQLGYKVIGTDEKTQNSDKLSSIEKRFLFTLPFTIVLFFSHMFFSHDFILNNEFIQLILCIPVLYIGINQFGKSAWGSLKTGVPNMDVLIFIGSTSAFIYSIIGMYLYNEHEVHNYLFFETTATIITLVLLGNVLEHRSVKQTTSAIKELNKMQVTTAKLVGLQMGKEIITEIKYEEIVKGSILLVNTGDKIPVDGEIIFGNAFIDESMLTGESIPKEKSIGDKITGGTIITHGSIKMRTEKIGKETVLAQIIDMVKKAQHAKPDIQKLGDKISAVFVPIVLIISICTFLVSYFAISINIQQALMNSIAVLVISCPCAMGLATPTAVMVGIGRAAKNGILIKGGDTLEKFAQTKNIVFDKTGTITTGEFKIKKITVLNNSNETEIKKIVYNTEKHSSHPIAKSIIKEFNNKTEELTFKTVSETKGEGIVAVDNENNEYKVGSYKIASTLTDDKTHNIYVLKNNTLIGTIDLGDELKNNVVDTIKQIDSVNINTILLSGDNKIKCEEIASQIKIKEVYYEQLPSQKLEVIEKLKQTGITAMVGDGINDAPALAASDIGISISNSSQIAIESAKIILLNNKNLKSLLDAHLISKHTLLTIKQNLFWAFAYNIVAIPIAAAGYLSPIIGALAMALSDVIVIGNSLRLKVKKLR